MVSSRCVISSTFRGHIPQKNRTGIDNVFRNHHITFCGNNQVFGSVFIGEGNGFFERFHNNYLAVFQCFFGNFFSWKFIELYQQLIFYLFHQFFGGGYKQHLTIGSVLGLRKQIGSHKHRVGCFVGNHFHFRGSGGHIYSHFAQRNQLLGGSNILIARSEYLIHFRNGFGAVSHSGDGLCTANFENAVNTGNFCSVEYCRMNFSFGIGWCAKYHFFTFGYLCRNAQHQHGGKQRSAASRNVKSYFFNRNGFLPAINPRRSLYFIVIVLLLGVKFPDVAARHFNSLLKLNR